MNDALRFLIAILIAIGILILAVLLLPLVLTGAVLFGVLAAITMAAVFVVGVVLFFWYAARNDPKQKKTMNTNNYSIKQGKERK